MTEKTQTDVCMKLLQKLRGQSKAYSEFQTTVDTLQCHAKLFGFEDDNIELLANIIIKIDLSATRMVSLIICLIPKYKVPDKVFKLIAAWFLSSVDQLPYTVSNIITQWMIGLWDYNLINKKVVNIFYAVFFSVMLKNVKLEKQLARLVYILTRPEDVTRKNVCCLLALNKKYPKPRKHVTVILSLFKAYKPELVPESIHTVNVESTWRPIPDVLQAMFQNAKARLEIQQTSEMNENCFKWNTFDVQRKKQKTVPPLVPSVGYFQIGSSIFKEKETTSIFDISSTEDLGKSHLSVELPANAVSLLANMAGHHLLTYADFQYQCRFSYNLYNTLIRAFILESEKFSEEEKNKLLDMTIEFSRYVQQGIPIVTRFLDEYFHFNTGEYQSKILALVQWMTFIPINDLRDRVLVHLQNIFYESTIEMKCEIIDALKELIINLFIVEEFKECYETTSASFLEQRPIDNFKDVVSVLLRIAQDLIVSGLNVHAYNSLLLTEAISFYEEICMVETRSRLAHFTLAPEAVIYGGFLTKNSAILSSTCNLLLSYRNMTKLKYAKYRVPFKLKRTIYIVSVYAQNIVDALWVDESVTREQPMFFFRDIPENMIEDFGFDGFEKLCNISNHYSILPYKWMLKKTGLTVKRKHDVFYIVLHHLPIVAEFLNVFLS